MQLTNRLNLPYALVAAIANDSYVGGGDISVTKLIDSPQIRTLGRKYNDSIVVDVSERIWALMGQAVHPFSNVLTHLRSLSNACLLK